MFLIVKKKDENGKKKKYECYINMFMNELIESRKRNEQNIVVHRYLHKFEVCLLKESFFYYKKEKA